MATVLGDFGLARTIATGSRLTRTGTALGTPAYMSPEQARGAVHDLTPATDVWALGCILYELIAGRRPFEGETAAATIGQILTASPPPLHAVRPGLPRDVGALVGVALARAPGERHASAGVLRDELSRLLVGEPLRIRARGRRRPGRAVLACLAGAGILVTAWGATRSRAGAGPGGRSERAAHAWDRRATDPVQARAALGEALAAEPARHEWALQLGLLAWAAGDRDEALRRWDAIPTSAPESARAAWLAGLSLAARGAAEGRRGLWTAVEERWRRAAEGRGAEARWAAAGLRFLADDFDGARDALAGESDWEAALLLGLCATSASDVARPWAHEVAVRAYTRVLEHGLPFAFAYTNRGVARNRLGDTAAAEADYDQALRVRPGDGVALINRGAQRRRRGDRAGARADLEAGVRAEPGIVDGWLALGDVRREAGDLPAAAEAYGEALRRDPRELIALTNRGGVRLALDDFVGALADYEAAVEIAPEAPDARANRGYLRWLTGDREGATIDFDAALAVTPDHRFARRGRGVARAARGDNAGALEDLDAVLAEDPADVMARRTRGYLHYAAGAYAASIADYDAALAVRPDTPELLGYRGTARGRAGDLAGAIADIERALALATPDWAERPKLEEWLVRLRATRSGG